MRKLTKEQIVAKANRLIRFINEADMEEYEGGVDEQCDNAPGETNYENAKSFLLDMEETLDGEELL